MEVRPGRVRHGETFWLGHILECERAGVEVKAYAMEHGLGEQNLNKWRRKLSQRGVLTGDRSPPMFRRMEVRQETASPEKISDTTVATISNCRIRLPNGTVLKVSGRLSTGLIGHLLQVVGVLPMVAGGNVQ